MLVVAYTISSVGGRLGTGGCADCGTVFTAYGKQNFLYFHGNRGAYAA